MKTFLSQNTLARRLNMTGTTLLNRIRESGIEPDGVVINGNKNSSIFDADKLPQLRSVLVPQNPERNIV
jgi:hypothetical protein